LAQAQAYTALIYRLSTIDLSEGGGNHADLMC